jgi:hypothetical protein
VGLTEPHVRLCTTLNGPERTAGIRQLEARPAPPRFIAHARLILDMLNSNPMLFIRGGGGVRVRIDDGGTATDLAAGWLVNCTGPAADITAANDPLLSHLLDSGLARPDPLRLGLDTDSHGGLRDATGRPSTDMFTLGPLLRGRWYETTATPEIRDQAAVLARFLLTSRALAGPGNAA